MVCSLVFLVYGIIFVPTCHSEPPSQIIQGFGELVEGFVVVKYLGHVYSLLTLVMVASYPPPGYS